jgi:acetolactate synthase-1/2/3 large subunit
MKLSAYVAGFLRNQGVRHVFVLQGGAVAHLIDAIGDHLDLEYVCPGHEQAAAMAADGYARVTGGLGCAMATTGPGVINMMTGIASLYYDSVPAIFIAGQVSTFRLGTNTPGVRQLGFQEAPHVEMLRPITKYAVLVDDPSRIRFELEKAVWLARNGRPGPVFVDICDDVQRADIDPDRLESFVPPAPVHNPAPAGDMARIDAAVDTILELLAAARRPVLILGAAVHLSGSDERALRLVERLGIPVALTWAVADLIPWSNPLNTGGFGVSATRRGNFAVQNADFILSLGSRLDTHATGSPIATFAREARKVIVDIDAAELDKFAAQGMPVDVPLRADLRDVLAAFERRWNTIEVGDIAAWKQRIAGWRDAFPVCRPEFRDQQGSVNPYVFLDTLSDETAEGDIIIPDTGANLVQTFQGYRVKAGQKIFSAFNNTPMGYSLSASIGACFANDRKPVICITGDGGLQLNMQELGTVVRYNLPIRIFLFNNHGYGIIQQTQEDWLGGRFHASRAETGLMDPDYVAIARAFGMSALSIAGHAGLRRGIRTVLDHPGPILCNLELSPGQRIVPMLKAGRPIEDPQPLLDRAEFLANMIVEPLAISRTR